jgi:RimJ/RimL family protein N-acetyltransferase
VITTPRLLLRTWRESDRASFAALNADPAVMEFFPSGLNGDESEQTVALMEAHQKEHGFCFFAAELVGKAPFIGFIGISNGPFEAPFTPAVEVGWRLARPYWNRGLATEGATAVLSYAFDFDHPRLPAVTRYGDTSYIALDGEVAKSFLVRKARAILGA